MNWRASTGLSRLTASSGRTASIALAAGLLFLTGCSNHENTPSADGSDPSYQANDPLEPANRVVWKIDLKLDHYVLRPVAKAYRDHTPTFVQKGFNNVLHNIKSPIILVNDVLQGNAPHAGQTFARIVMNSLVGVGGLFDVAGSHGIPYHDSDFGQTLGVWGVGPGPYLVLPILGPSDPRDLTGYGVDTVIDPFSYEMRIAGVSTDANLARTGATTINDRSKSIDDLDDLQRNSLDFYAAVRSLYQQKRSADVAEGKDHTSLAKQTSSAADMYAGPKTTAFAAADAGGATGSAIPLVEGAGGHGRPSSSYSQGPLD
jgi:phospholipid-binding lipoprotein MlaA